MVRDLTHRLVREHFGMRAGLGAQRCEAGGFLRRDEVLERYGRYLQLLRREGFVVRPALVGVSKGGAKAAIWPSASRHTIEPSPASSSA